MIRPAVGLTVAHASLLHRKDSSEVETTSSKAFLRKVFRKKKDCCGGRPRGENTTTLEPKAAQGGSTVESAALEEVSGTKFQLALPPDTTSKALTVYAEELKSLKIRDKKLKGNSLWKWISVISNLEMVFHSDSWWPRYEFVMSSLIIPIQLFSYIEKTASQFFLFKMMERRLNTDEQILAGLATTVGLFSAMMTAILSQFGEKNANRMALQIKAAHLRYGLEYKGNAINSQTMTILTEGANKVNMGLVRVIPSVLSQLLYLSQIVFNLRVCDVEEENTSLAIGLTDDKQKWEMRRQKAAKELPLLPGMELRVQMGGQTTDLSHITTFTEDQKTLLVDFNKKTSSGHLLMLSEGTVRMVPSVDQVKDDPATKLKDSFGKVSEKFSVLWNTLLWPLSEFVRSFPVLNSLAPRLLGRNSGHKRLATAIFIVYFGLIWNLFGKLYAFLSLLPIGGYALYEANKRVTDEHRRTVTEQQASLQDSWQDMKDAGSAFKKEFGKTYGEVMTKNYPAVFPTEFASEIRQKSWENCKQMDFAKKFGLEESFGWPAVKTDENGVRIIEENSLSYWRSKFDMLLSFYLPIGGVLLVLMGMSLESTYVHTWNKLIEQEKTAAKAIDTVVNREKARHRMFNGGLNATATVLGKMQRQDEIVFPMQWSRMFRKAATAFVMSIVSVGFGINAAGAVVNADKKDGKGSGISQESSVPKAMQLFMAASGVGMTLASSLIDLGTNTAAAVDQLYEVTADFPDLQKAWIRMEKGLATLPQVLSDGVAEICERGVEVMAFNQFKVQNQFATSVQKYLGDGENVDTGLHWLHNILFQKEFVGNKFRVSYRKDELASKVMCIDAMARNLATELMKEDSENQQLKEIIFYYALMAGRRDQDIAFSVSLENLKLYTRGTNDAWLTVPDGQFDDGSVNLLTGTSGCGKSTLLSIIMGHMKVDHGKVFYELKRTRKTNWNVVKDCEAPNDSELDLKGGGQLGDHDLKSQFKGDQIVVDSHCISSKIISKAMDFMGDQKLRIDWHKTLPRIQSQLRTQFAHVRQAKDPVLGVKDSLFTSLTIGNVHLVEKCAMKDKQFQDRRAKALLKGVNPLADRIGGWVTAMIVGKAQLVNPFTKKANETLPHGSSVQRHVKAFMQFLFADTVEDSDLDNFAYSVFCDDFLKTQTHRFWKKIKWTDGCRNLDKDGNGGFEVPSDFGSWMSGNSTVEWGDYVGGKLTPLETDVGKRVRDFIEEKILADLSYLQRADIALRTGVDFDKFKHELFPCLGEELENALTFAGEQKLSMFNRTTTFEMEPRVASFLKDSALPLKNGTYMVMALARPPIKGETEETIYSGGESARLEVVREMMRNPKVIFADEAAAGLSVEAPNQVLLLYKFFGEYVKRREKDGDPAIIMAVEQTGVSYVKQALVGTLSKGGYGGKVESFRFPKRAEPPVVTTLTEGEFDDAKGGDKDGGRKLKVVGF